MRSELSPGAFLIRLTDFAVKIDKNNTISKIHNEMGVAVWI